MALSKIDLANMVENVAPESSIPDVNFRNIFINGDMSQAQRATSQTGINGTNYHTVDRFKNIISGLGTWTMSQSTDVPTGQGFANSIKMDCTTADASPAAGDFNTLAQIVEGANIQHLKKGTSSAESTTWSFWVKSNKTGTYICEILDGNNTRQISKSYTINSADTWEKKEITFPGDTSGSIGTGTSDFLQFNWWLAVGSDRSSGALNTSWNSTTNANRAVGQVNLADSTSNEWYLTGVQLEAGTSASDFEFLPHDVNLTRCQRYYHQIYSQSGTQAFSDTLDLANCTNYDAGQLFCMKDLPTTMRTIPSIVQTTGTDYLLALRNGAQDGFDGFNGVGKAGYNNIAIFTSGAENYSGVAGVSARVRCNASYKLAANAEL